MSILITGATGFIGRFLLPTLLAEGATAVTLLLRPHYQQRPLPSPLNTRQPQFNMVYADLQHLQQTVQAVKEAKPTYVYHLAAAGVTEPFLDLETAVAHNIHGTLNLLRACFEETNTTKQLIVTRTPGEQTMMNVYATSKAAAWNFCQMYSRTHSWPIHGAMIYQAYGPGQSQRNLIPAAITAALANQDFPMTAGTQQRDWVHISDVVRGLIALRNNNLKSGSSVDLGSGQLTSVADVVRKIYALVGGNGRPQIGHIPSRPGEDMSQVADAQRTKELLGWATAVTLAEGLRDQIVRSA